MRKIFRSGLLCAGFLFLCMQGLKAQDAVKVTATPVNNTNQEYVLSLSPFNSVDAGYLAALAQGDGALFEIFQPDYARNEFRVKLNRAVSASELEQRVATEIQRGQKSLSAPAEGKTLAPVEGTSNKENYSGRATSAEQRGK